MQSRSLLPAWRIDDAKLVASLRWHASWAGFYIFAVLWNLGLLLFVHDSPTFTLVGYLAVFLFGLLALRTIFSRTTMRFDADTFVVETPLAFWQRLEVPIGEIDHFEMANPKPKVFTVVVRLKSNAVLDTPIDWQPLPIAVRGTNHDGPLFAAAPEDAQWLADALNEMLANARQLGHDTYRS